MSENARKADATIRMSLIAIGCLVTLLILMATVFRVSGAVIASGNVSVEGDVKQITHPTGGIVSQVLVKNGQIVKKGQPLIRLDSTVSGIGSDSTDQSLQAMLARRERLEREQRGSASYVAPSGVSNDSLSAKEKMLFDQRKQSQIQGHAQMRERMNQIEQGIISLQAQIKSINRQRELFEKEQKGIQTLYDKGLVTITRYTQTERTAVDLESQAEGLKAQLAQSRAQLSELHQRDSQLTQDFRSEAGNELASLNIQLGDMQIQSASRNDQNQRNEIKSPYDGIVDKLAYTTIGSYMPAGQVILEVVPNSDRQLIEVRIALQDIDQVAIGQQATLHFSAFSQQTTPTLPGTIEWISAERAIDPATGASFYRAHIGINQADLANLGSLEVKVGMPVEAYIETGSRTIMSYLLKPLRDQIERAFR